MSDKKQNENLSLPSEEAVKKALERRRLLDEEEESYEAEIKSLDGTYSQRIKVVKHKP